MWCLIFPLLQSVLLLLGLSVVILHSLLLIILLVGAVVVIAGDAATDAAVPRAATTMTKTAPTCFCIRVHVIKSFTVVKPSTPLLCHAVKLRIPDWVLTLRIVPFRVYALDSGLK